MLGKKKTKKQVIWLKQKVIVKIYNATFSVLHTTPAWIHELPNTYGEHPITADIYPAKIPQLNVQPLTPFKSLKSWCRDKSVQSENTVSSVLCVEWNYIHLRWLQEGSDSSASHQRKSKQRFASTSANLANDISPVSTFISGLFIGILHTALGHYVVLMMNHRHHWPS